MRLLRVLAWVVAIASLAASTLVVLAFVQPVSGADRVRAQVGWLNRARAGGAADDMQRLFPEGAFFTHVLTGLAAASIDDAHTVASALDASGADSVKAVFGTIPALDGGLRRIGTVRDPASGLLAHRISAEGMVREGPRGSSQALIQMFWPDLDPASTSGEWARFVDAFVVREAGLVGVREYPRGDDSPGDVDSGPLVFGVSASASAVTLAAAGRNGAHDLAADLDHEAEYLGLPLEWSGERRFAFGLLPVGDAFVAWARGVPATEAAGPATPRPLWWAHALVLLLPGLAATGWLFWPRHEHTT